jgi:acyl-[acyl-carrier-protein]-phospholipid O-acyltransferase/long-chain-fatty-acid--[acyl-carrier-protein] ligase
VRGRRKRFAKIAGEMVSLTTVEEVASKLWPGRLQAVIALEDDRRGERLVLVTEDPPALALEHLRLAVRDEGLSEFYAPRQLLNMKVPLYPVGKINMPQLMIEARAADAARAAARAAEGAARAAEGRDELEDIYGPPEEG